MNKYRYLLYDIDKHQSSPRFYNEIQDWMKLDADACLSVIVDLETMKRYFSGEWEPITVPKEAKK